jgi:hypothetical protein
LPVFEERELHAILKRVGLLERLLSNTLRCSFCNDVISGENFGALFAKQGTDETAVSCNRSECLRLVVGVAEE